MRIGIVGCGRMGIERARSSAACGAQVVAVWDEDRVRAESLAAQHNGCAVTQGLFASGLDAVFVCTPPSSRGSVELEAIKRRVPFFVEKPIAVTARQAEPIAHALACVDLVHAVGYQNRCRSSVGHVRMMLKGRTVLGISAFWAGRKYVVPWWLHHDQSGGPVNEQATHLLDLCRFLCGEVESVAGSVGSVTAEPDEQLSAALSLRFVSGALGSLLYSCESNDKQIGLRILTQQGGLTLSSWDLALTLNEIDGTGITTQQEDVFVVETRRFLDAVAAGDPQAVGCHFDDALRTQYLVDRVLKEIKR